MSRWLVPKLASLTTNYFTVKDSFTFARKISQVENNHFHMARFDIKSIFTNIPIKETCNIILEELLPSPDSVFDETGFTRAKILDLCTKNNLFLFNNQLYMQLDGAPMGRSISPILANIFLCHQEENWINDCPPEFKPISYCRYVDDTFALFNNPSQMHWEK